MRHTSGWRHGLHWTCSGSVNSSYSPINMFRYPASAIALLFSTTVFCGCSYDRSFMQMDSNSGVPFFGFQWAVDSGSRPPESGSDDDEVNEMRPSLIDLRAPSKLHQPGRDHRALEAGRYDVQTVSISHTSLVPVRMTGGFEARADVIEPDDSDDIPVRAIMPKSHSFSAAKLFQDRRAAF
ncbi:MAG: hypothetical protein ACK58L_11455 [Planctomycetota bacterium]